MEAIHDNQQGAPVEPEREQANAGQKCDIKKILKWHREACAHFNRYKPTGIEAERMVYGKQWSDDDKAYLESQGRLPLVFNHIQKNVFSMYGHRAANKYEIKYLPREASDTEEAEILTQVAKFYWDYNRAEFEFGRSTLQQYIGPLGWVFLGVENENPSREPIKFEATPWKEMRYDPKAERHDLLDARYLFREKWRTLEEAQFLFPEHAERLKGYASKMKDDPGTTRIEEHGGDPYSDQNTTPIKYVSESQDVRIVECWYRQKVRGHYLMPPGGEAVPFDAHNPQHQLAKLQGMPTVPGVIDKVYWVTFVGDLVLEEGDSPYSHGFFPYVAVWGLKDDENLPCGAVEALKDLQKSYNWSVSKLLWLAASRQWKMPHGAVPDMSSFQENAARPDGVIEYNPEHGAPEPIDNSGAVVLNSNLASMALDGIKEVGGSPEESRGQESNAKSGKAILARQDAALRQQGLFLDNEQRALMQMGEMLKSLIKDNVTDEKIIRINAPNGQMQRAVVNVTDPLRRQALEAQGFKVYGTFTEGQYDTAVVISPLSATLRQARAEEQDAIAESLPPEMFAAIAHIWLEGKDVPEKERMIEAVKTVQQAILPPPPGAAPPMPPGMPPEGAMPPPPELMPPGMPPGMPGVSLPPGPLPPEVML